EVPLGSRATFANEETALVATSLAQHAERRCRFGDVLVGIEATDETFARGVGFFREGLDPYRSIGYGAPLTINDDRARFQLPARAGPTFGADPHQPIGRPERHGR